jgi:Arc/MetJ-type ribon-helix-helix transcriptional regulator
VSIDLDQDTQRLIEQEIQAGGFRDAAAFVGAAVRHFLITREDLGSTREQIDAMIAGAVASLERGAGVDGEEFFAELEREERQLHRQQG